MLISFLRVIPESATVRIYRKKYGNHYIAFECDACDVPFYFWHKRISYIDAFWENDECKYKVFLK